MQNLKNTPKHTDARGTIQMVLESCRVGSISIIDSAPETTRASHYHKKDGHTILVNEGQIFLYERPAYSEETPKLLILNKGDYHYTGPMVEHEMFFPCHTSFWCFSDLPRDSDSYEGDTVRFSHSLRVIHNKA
jgi:hypothetical protein